MQAWLRIALGYHTLPQVAAGWLVGSLSAAAWWRLGQAWLAPTLAARPGAAAWLYGATGAGVVFFSVQNVARWVREHREEARPHGS